MNIMGSYLGECKALQKKKTTIRRYKVEKDL
jgi:hypothetical protein